MDWKPGHSYLCKEQNSSDTQRSCRNEGKFCIAFVEPKFPREQKLNHKELYNLKFNSTLKKVARHKFDKASKNGTIYKVVSRLEFVV